MQGFNLKPCLVEVAQVAVEGKEQPYYVNKSNRIFNRRGKKRVYISIARLVAIYYMFFTRELLNSRELSHIEIPIEQRNKYLKNNLKFDVR